MALSAKVVLFDCGVVIWKQALASILRAHRSGGFLRFTCCDRDDIASAMLPLGTWATLLNISVLLEQMLVDVK